MATKRALSHLNAIVVAQERISQRLIRLITRMQQYNASIDAILQDGDRTVAEVITEATTGLEALSLAQMPVQAGSTVLYLDDVAVHPSAYKVNLATGQILWVGELPIDQRLRAEYVVEGLTSQVDDLIATMPEFTAQGFLDVQASYETAIAWIEQEMKV